MSTTRPFHHGDLKTALIRSAADLVEQSGADALSLREVARHAGVSSAAPYRHYANREMLLAEVAREGFERLHDQLITIGAGLERQSAFLAQCIAYIRFAEQNPALYRLMFGGLLDKRQHEGLIEAGDRLFALLDDPDPGRNERQPYRAMRCWAFVHGLAMLTLDGLLAAHLSGTTDEHLLAIMEPLIAVLVR